MATADRNTPILAELLFNAAFDGPRDPRSAEYKVGVRACLAYHAHGAPLRSPYPMGTVQADAFYAGVDEGHQLWRAHQALEAARRRRKQANGSGND